MLYEETRELVPPEITFGVAKSGVNCIKVKSDAMRLKRAARFVFVLKPQCQKPELIYNPKGYIANVIAVLGPAIVGGEAIEEALLLEIGLSRSRPYQSAEKNKEKGVWKVGGRTRVRPLSGAEFDFLWPHLGKTLAAVSQLTRSKWATKSPWRVVSNKGAWEANRGARFTVSKEDRLILRVLLQHAKERRLSFLREYAGRLGDHLRRYKFVSYPDHELKRLVGLQDAVESWRRASLEPFEQQYVLKSMAAKPQALFREGLRVFRLRDPLDELPERRRRLNGFPRLRGADIRLIRKGRVHGKNCVTFEFAFERRFCAQHGL